MVSPLARNRHLAPTSHDWDSGPTTRRRLVARPKSCFVEAGGEAERRNPGATMRHDASGGGNDVHFVGSILSRELAAPGARASQRNRHWPDS